MAELLQQDDGWYIHLVTIWDHGVASGVLRWTFVDYHFVGPFSESEARDKLRELQEGVAAAIQEGMELGRQADESRQRNGDQSQEGASMSNWLTRLRKPFTVWAGIYAFGTALSWWASGDFNSLLWHEYELAVGWITFVALVSMLPTACYIIVASVDHLQQDEWLAELVFILMMVLAAWCGIVTGMWLAFG
jgi:hypothetical protein